MKTIDIYTNSNGKIEVWVWRENYMNCHKNVTRASLIRAQRMQLKLFDAMKGQSPNDT